jgi:hypothetical protein
VTLEQIFTIIRADPNLTDEQKEALCDPIRAAYLEMTAEMC